MATPASPSFTDSTTFQLSITLIAAACLYSHLASSTTLFTPSQNGLPLPPSPPSDPIIGNARVMPLEYAFKTFGSWVKSYGDLIYVSVLGRPMIIVNSVQAARDLMEKKGAIYSSRPRMEILGEMMGWSNTLPFLKYGERFRKHRRMMQQHFNERAVTAFRPIQQNQVNEFLKRVVEKPDNVRKDMHRLIASSILMATFGHEVTSDNDPYIALVNRTTKMSTDAGSPGGTIIDLFPALRHVPEWLPFMGLKRHALATRALVQEVMQMPLSEIKEKRAKGTPPACYVNHLLDEYETRVLENGGRRDIEHEEDIRCIGAVIYSAGVETTEATIASFLLLMTLHPEVVKRAQQELDALLDNDSNSLPRLPTYEDRLSGKLPYLECIVKEVFRISPAVPIGIPHESVKEDTYRGWRIPEGSMVMPNIWNMMRDEKVYGTSGSLPSKKQGGVESFEPERFLKKVQHADVDGDDTEEDEDEGKTGVKEEDPSSIVFGFGRRLCPGRHFAEVTMWLTYASLLAAFDISYYVDPVTGKEEIPECKFVGGTSHQPEPFRCSVKPRSERWRNVIRELC